MNADPATLSSLLAVAVGTGVVHTVLGPDHYLPWIGLARDRDWSARRTLGVTALAGVVHCAASALLVPLAALLADSAVALTGLQDVRSALAAWLLVGLGAVLLLAAWRRRPTGKAMPALLLAAFALGPCEWLVPNALAAWSLGGLGTALLVALAFTAATVATMLATVAFGLRLLPAGLRFGGALPGALCLLSGGLILLGL